MENGSTESDLMLLLPEFFLLGWAVLQTVAVLLFPGAHRKSIGYASLAALSVCSVLVMGTGQGVISEGLFINDASSIFFKIIFLGSAVFSTGLLIWGKESSQNFQTPFVFSLLLLSVTGMMFLSLASNLLSLYISMELSTIPIMLIAAFCHNEANGLKTAGKYISINLLASGLILYGMSFLYGLSGTANLTQMKIHIAVIHLTQREIGVIILLAVALILAGLMIKLALPPFHRWALDVYQKLPLPIVTFISIGFATAVLTLFIKIFIDGLFAFYGPEQAPNDWGRPVALVALLVITGGTVLLIRQKDVRRTIFYIYIVQIGYVLIGAVAMNKLGLQSAGFYLFAFMLAGSGAATVAMLVQQSTGSTSLESFRGLAKSSLPLSILLGLFLMSLGGLPLLAGFVAKYSVFEAAIAMAQTDEVYYWMYLLAGGGIFMALVGFIYFVRITISLFGNPGTPPAKIELPVPLMFILVLAAGGIIFFGIFPDILVEFASGLSESFGFMLN